MKDNCEIYLVRHGETDWNVQKRVQTHTDIPLNKKGIEQAYQLKERLASIPFSHAYCSNLSRARETLQIILQNRSIPFIEKEELRESFLASFEGEPEHNFWDCLTNNPPPIDSQEAFLSHTYHPDIEPYSVIYNRFDTFLEKHIEEHFGSKILICSHAGTIASLLHKLDFKPKTRRTIHNGAVVIIRATATTREILSQEGITIP